MIFQNSRIILVSALILLAVAGGAYIFHIQKGAETAPADMFETACITPVLAGEDDIGLACLSLKTIKETYNVDAEALIDKQYKKMALTAKRIAEGQLQNPNDYKECIKRDECAEVPLLPSGIDPQKMTAEQERMSTAFWDLVEEPKITAPVCALIRECEAMVKVGVVDYGFKVKE